MTCQHADLKITLHRSSVTNARNMNISTVSAEVVEHVDVVCTACGMRFEYEPLQTTTPLTVKREAVRWFYVLAKNAERQATITA